MQPPFKHYYFIYLLTQEEQTVGNKTYSHYKKDNFDCGRFKLLTEIDGGELSEVKESQPNTPVHSAELRKQFPADFLFWFFLQMTSRSREVVFEVSDKTVLLFFRTKLTS